MDDLGQEDLPLSRTKKKQQAQQVGQLAEQLVGLTDNQFSKLKLPDEIIREAVLARSTTGRSSQRRQLKHFSALLRKSEEALENLQGQLENLDQVSRSEKKQFHQLEKLRDQLCQKENFDAAFSAMLEITPRIDRKVIARLARSVHQHEDKRAYREIFKRLRDELED
ncbi:MAG: DUF615 domain-containing protein [Deltaproteobacteria bacterium]|jgi:ribosome-associated protein|nr:DUF615 domain-containing protein [Deltaproteobacteria bacterium]MCW8892126.1 DUF615 domain-containing protein [Deltaproteobacteria bacterium]MCW9050638.1 DUF615 domain-containing protein [Deltaproteobacteria bacterium]